ncbi:MAG: trimeric intracellular cation channel family protein, partial [Thermomicrobiales bacterium]
ARKTRIGMIDSDSIFIIFDLVGVFVGALTGALVAHRLRYDITGLWGIALVSGLGGGIIRDICLQNGPPLALIEPTYLPTVLAATVAGAFFGGHLDRLRKTILVTDAIALATFAVAGSLRTFDSGLHVWPAVLLGVITAVGGGIIRDILTGETPMIFRNGELYALAALGACLTVVLFRSFDSPRTLTVFSSMIVGITLRLGSVRFGWTSWVPK